MHVKFKCYFCGLSYTRKSWHTIWTDNAWVTACDDCYSGASSYREKRRKPLTEWQKKKLSWYRNERRWHEDIEGRRLFPNGKVGVFDAKGNLKEVRD